MVHPSKRKRWGDPARIRIPDTHASEQQFFGEAMVSGILEGPKLFEGDFFFQQEPPGLAIMMEKFFLQVYLGNDI